MNLAANSIELFVGPAFLILCALATRRKEKARAIVFAVCTVLSIAAPEIANHAIAYLRDANIIS